MQVRREIQDLYEKVKQYRKDLHQIPEIGLDTKQTKAYIKEVLSQYPSIQVEEGYAKNGLVAYLKVHDEGSAIAFRADMDGLPLQETTNLPFASKNEGCSHACGHDGHMAILLGFIAYVYEHKDSLQENLVFIFQPGEEGPGGAALLIQEGLFEKYPIRAIFGTHLMSDVEKGKIACKAGAMMACNGEFNISVFGQTAHGAMPHLGKDAIVAASHLVVQLQSIASRMLDPLAGSVITIGTMQGGQARNVICDEMQLQGTMRAFDDGIYESMKQQIHGMCNAIASSFHVQIEAEILDYYYAVDNDSDLYGLLQEATGKDCLVQVPKMIAEDFSFYQKEVPGVFYFTGVKDERHTKGIHDSAFNFDEEALLVSIETNARVLETMEVL